MKKAFSIVELIIVIVLLAILARFAMPNFFDMRFKSQVNAFCSTAKSIKAGLRERKIDSILTTGTILNSPSLSINNSSKYFEMVLDKGIKKGSANSGWSKAAAANGEQYIYSFNASEKITLNYTSQGITISPQLSPAHQRIFEKMCK